MTVVAAAVLATVSTPAALAFAALGLAAIYVRGYLVPWTPTLTKRYLPTRVLRWFDHAATPAADSDVDVPAVLAAMGVVVDTGTDLEVAPSFERRWFERVRAIEADGRTAAALAAFLDVDPDALALDSLRGAVAAYVDDVPAGQWESRTALLADLAAARELAGVPEWTALSLAQRSEVLGGLRAVLTRCPGCGGDVTFEATVAESCCRSVDVLAATCDDCDARLFELEYDPSALGEAAD